MDQSILSSRAVMGMYFARLEANPGLSWVNAISNLFDSDQAAETYAMLGPSPVMSEWIGGRQAKGLYGNELTIVNKHYEATLEIALKDMRRDKTPQIQARVEEFADRTLTHWASLLSTLIINGESTTGYDGQYFFDTDHTEDDNTTAQSNDISVDISAIPASVHGTTTAPSVEELQQAAMQGVTQIINFKDGRNEPMNEFAQEFMVMVPPTLYMTALSAFTPAMTTALIQNLNANVGSEFRIRPVTNPRLSDWTDKFTVWRTDSPTKALIRQQETEVETKVKDEMSEFAFDNDAIQIGVDAWRNVGYGYWQGACLVTMT